MSDLRQILSQGRKRLALLIGAGAPLSIKVDSAGKIDASGTSLIPGINELTERVTADWNEPEASVIRSIRKDLDGAHNIETILSRVRLLEQAIGSSSMHGFNAEQYRALGASLCARIGEIVNVSLPQERNAYDELVAWVSGTLRSAAVEIFTTNYDLLLEEAFEHARAPYFDGFTGAMNPFFDPVTVLADDLPRRWSRLWKLHGSIGWDLAEGVVVRTGGRRATQLVYPDHLKYDLTQKQPYAALFERLKDFLLTADTLLIAVGFSFSDAHVCAVLDEALGMNANTAVFAFQYGRLQDETSAAKLANAHPNFSLYAADGAIISGIQALWAPGEPPQSWSQIRAGFWGHRIAGEPPVFLLGDFVRFARFCALAQAIDVLVNETTDAPTTESRRENGA